MTFVFPDGAERVVDAPAGLSILEIARLHDIDIEGACGGWMACATCHIIVEAGDFERLDEPSAEEDEMLDLAIGPMPTSRLGCQVVMREDLNGLRVHVPASTLLSW